MRPPFINWTSAGGLHPKVEQDCRVILARLHTILLHMTSELATPLTSKSCSEEQNSFESTLPRVTLSILMLRSFLTPLWIANDPKKMTEQYKWPIYLRTQLRLDLQDFIKTFLFCNDENERWQGSFCTSSFWSNFLWVCLRKQRFAFGSNVLELFFQMTAVTLVWFFPFPPKCQKIFSQTMAHSYLVYNCGAGIASASCISGANILSFWVYELAKPTCLSQIIAKIQCRVKLSLENPEFGGQTPLTKHNGVCSGNVNIQHVRCTTPFVLPGNAWTTIFFKAR